MARTIAKECPAIRSRRMSRLLTRMFDAELRELGIQTSQLSVLVAVAMHGAAGARIGSLAEHLVMDRTTVTRSIRPLEKAGLIRVSPARDDARARVVTLTRAGERQIEAAYPLWEKAHHVARQQLGAGRMDTLRVHIDDVIARAEA